MTEGVPISVRLEPMGEERFRTFSEREIPAYGQEHVRAGHWSPEEAAEKSKNAFEQLLPQGRTTPGHFLLQIVAEVEAGTVGDLWFADEGAKDGTSGFVFDLYIEPAFRRKGYGRAAMVELERFARARGFTRIALHVFSHNPNAFELYRTLGYRTMSMNMQKELPAAPR